MLLDLFRTLASKSPGWLSLDALIDKIKTLRAPALLRRDGELISHQGILELLLRHPIKRSLAMYHLKADDPNRIVVHIYTVVFPHDYLGSHVARSARGVAAVIWRPES